MDTHLCHEQGEEEDFVFWDIVILQERHGESTEVCGTRNQGLGAYKATPALAVTHTTLCKDGPASVGLCLAL